jgi:hypothetical protein
VEGLGQRLIETAASDEMRRLSEPVSNGTDEETVEWILAAVCFAGAALVVFGLDASLPFAIIPVAIGISFVYSAVKRSRGGG